jgi:hypothetical protein
MENSNEKVIALAQRIAKLMSSAGDREDALDAHSLARTFYRRLSSSSFPETTVNPQPKKRVHQASA